jgi:hypothetical protein
MVDVTNRAHVHMRLGALKFLLCHFLSGSSCNSICDQIAINGYRHAAAVP